MASQKCRRLHDWRRTRTGWFDVANDDAPYQVDVSSEFYKNAGEMSSTRSDPTKPSGSVVEVFFAGANFGDPWTAR